MRVLGIDPGYAIVGYGVVDYIGNKFSVVEYGAVTTQAGVPFDRRLETIYDDITVIDVSQARGVLMLAARKNGLEVFEYTPLQVKQSVVGYGRAEKKQVQEMTRRILGLESIPKPDDTADALAMAICHAHCSGSLMGKLRTRGYR